MKNNDIVEKNESKVIQLKRGLKLKSLQEDHEFKNRIQEEVPYFFTQEADATKLIEETSALCCEDNRNI
jgi:hypothetical protein